MSPPRSVVLPAPRMQRHPHSPLCSCAWRPRHTAAPPTGAPQQGKAGVWGGEGCVHYRWGVCIIDGLVDGGWAAWGGFVWWMEPLAHDGHPPTRHALLVCSVYNEILRRRPDLIGVLAGPWYFDRKVDGGAVGWSAPDVRSSLPASLYRQLGAAAAAASAAAVDSLFTDGCPKAQRAALRHPPSAAAAAAAAAAVGRRRRRL